MEEIGGQADVRSVEGIKLAEFVADLIESGSREPALLLGKGPKLSLGFFICKMRA